MNEPKTPTRPGRCRCGNRYDAGDLAIIRVSGRWLCVRCAESGLGLMRPEVRAYVERTVADRRQRLATLKLDLERLDAEWDAHQKGQAKP